MSVRICKLSYTHCKSNRRANATGATSLGAVTVTSPCTPPTQVAVANTLTRVVGIAASCTGAVAGVAWFHLNASGKAAKACLALFLWATLLLSEVRIVTQSTLLLLLYTAAFTLPIVYVEFRHVVEGLLVESHSWCSLVASHQSRMSGAAAAVAFAAVMGGV